MSRLATKPLTIPKGLEVSVNNENLTVSNKSGSFAFNLAGVTVETVDDQLHFRFTPKEKCIVGTLHARIRNAITGLTAGFQKKLTMVGVGYKASVQGKQLTLNVGYSLPYNYNIPEGITVEVPTQTEILVKGINIDLVGKVAAEIRSVRPPEPYKGKGIRYSDEVVVIKEAKK